MAGVRENGGKSLEDGPAMDARARRDFTQLGGHARTVRASPLTWALPARVIIFADDGGAAEPRRLPPAPCGFRQGRLSGTLLKGGETPKASFPLGEYG